MGLKMCVWLSARLRVYVVMKVPKPGASVSFRSELPKGRKVFESECV